MMLKATTLFRLHFVALSFFFLPFFLILADAQTQSCRPREVGTTDYTLTPCQYDYSTTYKYGIVHLSWPDGYQDEMRPNGHGGCTYYATSCCQLSSDLCQSWPYFYTPTYRNDGFAMQITQDTVCNLVLYDSTCFPCAHNTFRDRNLLSKTGPEHRYEPDNGQHLCTVGGGGTTAACGQSTGAYCFLSSNGATCNQGTVAIPPCCCFWSPIVIDISRYWDWTTNSGTGYQFTDAAGGVRFDLTGDGSTKQVAWPTATSENAWLALDRNGNGVIDSGKELFGNFTTQVGPSGETIPTGQGNGWLALAEFDRSRSGGNDNGIIDSGDAAFQNLRLWIDRNHNGISEPNELITLQSIGITRIELGYAEVPWTDQYGNSFRLRARFIWGSLDQEPYVEWYKDAWDVYPQWTP